MPPHSRFTIVATGIGAILVTRYISIMRPYTTSMIQIDNAFMGVFDITQSVVNDSAGVIISDTSIDIATVITDIEAKLDAMSVGGLLGLWFQSLFVGLTMKALSICIKTA